MTDSTPLSPAGDRHFDGLVEKFAGSLYGGPRGALRLAMLDALLPEMLELDGQPLLDVGGGLGQLSAWFARRGHPVTLLEPAGDMLEQARQSLEGLPVSFMRAPLQALPERTPGPWPLIACHAVLEWLSDPRAALATLADGLAPGGQLSLMVFNRDALRFSNVVKGNLQKALDDRLEGTGKRQRLTPISPLSHDRIVAWSRECGLSIRAVAGIRVFHDYLRHPPASEDDWQRLVALERRYCQVEPLWRLGRYLLYTLVKEGDLPTEENVR
ncbi:methyltransferase domain-containing protein [Halomonas sp. MCCC 1A17488]|uniref:methyltransferase domain-containing protein n=1 Tax=unclassified Halomonas TaxID=2609666 RepID=UPI0018D26803|nr:MULTISPECIES: methyltransferase domain-containing protein [unclassified Halomonas]MCE8018185.1 methyltransferase domain-containing protein [Halomonas sp. MCCC 1A17488]MCG3241518.1 methyltransferase domain-containing protein [Halomonas sp. MCCC 1A17488]QPP48527.1 methyltransferase domain-containing protein [Halomonas sp. SS10-MC5]